MDIYDKLGVKKFINAWGTVTSIGGSLMSSEVLQSMTEASKYYVDINELLKIVGQKIAELLHVESVLITSGAGAGLAISTAACMAGEDPAKIAQLPDTEGLKNEVLIFKSHRNRYDQAIRLSGAKFREIGLIDRTHVRQLENAIDDNVACLVYFAESEAVPGSLPLDQVSRILHEQNIPLIVDAAAELPPIENLRNYLSRGADLVLFSGGKELHGPQSTGLIIGKKGLITACAANSCPNHSIGRPMKVDKEGIIGIYTAIKLFIQRDFNKDFEKWYSKSENLISFLKAREGVTFSIDFPIAPDIQPVIIPRVFIRIDEMKLGVNKQYIYDKLREGNPGIVTGVFEKGLVINPQMLEDEEEIIIAKKINGILSSI